MFPFLYNLSLGLLVCLVRYLWSTLKRIRSLPPGPWGLPFVGYWPFLKQHNYLQFDELSRKYGKVFSMKLGQSDVVIVCGWDQMKEAFANEDLLAKPHAVLVPGIIDEASIVEMSGKPWREHRRVSLHVLRDVGFGKSEMEAKINEEIDNFCSIIEKQSVDDLVLTLLPSISNNISFLLFGHYFARDEPLKASLDKMLLTVARIPQLQFAGFPAFFPTLLKFMVFFKRSSFDEISKLFKGQDEVIKNEVEVHQARFEPDNVGDYIDGYLNEQLKRKDKDDQMEFETSTLKRNVSTFFGAGTETVTSTLSWALMYLITYPEYQEQIRREIDEVIGSDRKPDYSYRNQMPFTMSFIYEAHRCGSVIASNLLRRASNNTRIGDYFIPKDTTVIFNFWSVHMDPNLWENPSDFNPSRFLSQDGTKAVKPSYLVPFSGGKRNCPGEGLASIEVFLYLVSMVQKFKIKAKPGSQISLEADFGISRRPKNMPTLIFEKINSF